MPLQISIWPSGGFGRPPEGGRSVEDSSSRMLSSSHNSILTRPYRGRLGEGTPVSFVFVGC
eukprot:7322950-Pyramimonas_sp.AAC.1